MTGSIPHYLLLTATQPGQHDEPGRWHFLLHRLDCEQISIEAADWEPQVSAVELELLAVVRGLEALDQPSRVTLITEDDHVVRGLRYGLSEWKAAGWKWERFGRMVEIPHAPLWRRMDRALQFHTIRFRQCGTVDPHARWGAGSPIRYRDASSRRPPVPSSLRSMLPAVVRRLQTTVQPQPFSVDVSAEGPVLAEQPQVSAC